MKFLAIKWPTKPLERNLWWFYLTSFLSGLIFIIPIWVLFERRILSLAQMALIEAVATGLTMFLELPTGALADLFGRKTTAGIGLVLQGLGNVYSGFATEPMQFIVGFLVSSVGVALLSGANDALLYDTLKELKQEDRYAKVSSTNSMLFQVGIVIASLTGGYLYQYAIALPYVLYGLALILAGVVFFLMKEPTIDSEVFTLRNYLRQTKAGVEEIGRTKQVLELSIFYILIGGITWSAQVFFNQNYVVEIGLTPIQIGWLFGLTRIFNSVLIWRLAHSAWLNRERAFMLFAGLVVVAYVPAYWANQVVGSILMMVSTFASTARFVILGQYCNREFRSKNRATAISTLNMGVSLFYVLAMLIAGPIMEAKSTGLVFTLLGGFALVVVWPLTRHLVRNRAENLLKSS